MARARQNGRVKQTDFDDAQWESVRARLHPDPVTGLVAAIAQQWDTGEVLMVAWMDLEALRRTLTSGRATYWSRSRQAYWVKGETSGHAQHVRTVRLDCDGDAVLLGVDQVGAACHTGDRTCWDSDLLLDLGPTAVRPDGTQNATTQLDEDAS